MSRYIDADALESELFRDGIAGIFLNYPRRTKFTIGEIRGMLKNERITPTADVVPSERLENAMKLLDKTEDELYEARREIEKLSKELATMREILKTLNAYSEHIARDIPIVADVAVGKG